MVQRGSRNGGEAGETFRQALRGDGLPSLNRTPVMGDEVDRRVRAGLIDHGGEIFNENGQRVAGPARRSVGPSGTSHVVRDDVQVRGEAVGQGAPDGARIGEAVDEHNRGPTTLAVLGDGQRQPGAADSRLDHHGAESTMVR